MIYFSFDNLILSCHYILDVFRDFITKEQREDILSKFNDESGFGISEKELIEIINISEKFNIIPKKDLKFDIIKTGDIVFLDCFDPSAAKKELKKYLEGK